MNAAPAIRAVGIDKWFGRTGAVVGADVTVPLGSLVALLGPSGSGKSTLLRIIAGFEVPDAGTVEIDGRRVAGGGVWVEPEQRRVGMVFQDGALFPHLTVERNVAFGEPAPGRVSECLELVGLAHRAGSYPHELSGGERQRIALARALAPDPAVVLLDEPFAALDAGLRSALREDVAGILRRAGASALLVTHDQQEALSLADEVVLMDAGRVAQTGTPEEVYARPASRWVAGFLGAAEVLPGTAADGYVETELGRLPSDDPGARGPVEIMIRPEVLSLAPTTDTDDSDTSVVGEVLDRSFFGHDQLVLLRLPSGRRVRSRVHGVTRWRRGDTVRIRVDGPVHVLARLDPV
ncbi:MAG: ABC transporter ATP-binding protein [Acidimicrobiales bacterium]